MAEDVAMLEFMKSLRLRGQSTTPLFREPDRLTGLLGCLCIYTDVIRNIVHREKQQQKMDRDRSHQQQWHRLQRPSQSLLLSTTG